jgi:hypothetical protein
MKRNPIDNKDARVFADVEFDDISISFITPESTVVMPHLSFAVSSISVADALNAYVLALTRSGKQARWIHGTSFNELYKYSPYRQEWPDILVDQTDWLVVYGFEAAFSSSYVGKSTDEASTVGKNAALLQHIVSERVRQGLPTTVVWGIKPTKASGAMEQELLERIESWQELTLK